MLKYRFQNYFLLFLIIFENYGAAEEILTTEEISSTQQELESLQDKCTFGENLRVVTCNNVSDVSHFYRFLELSEHLGGSGTYDVIFNDVGHIPAWTFKGVSIYSLYLDGPDITIDENVFEGVVNLLGLKVRRSNIENIPDFRFVRTSIRIVKIESSSLTTLDGENFQNLTEIWDLSFAYNSIRFLDPDFFKGTTHVWSLTLSHNLLTSIPPTSLDAMTRLGRLDVSYNNLLHFEFRSSTAVSGSVDINLGSNNITDINSMLPLVIKNIRDLKLNLSGNPIKRIPEGILSEKIPNLERLYLGHCQLESFYLDRGLAKLTELVLSYNFLSDFGQDTRPIFLKRFQMTGNQFRDLAGIPKNSTFRYFDFDHNQIQYLTDEDFRHVEGVVVMTLEHNQIQRIDSDTFRTFRHTLRDLYLDWNRIVSLNGSVRHLSRLEAINLKHNSIQILLDDEFAFTDSLIYLDLQHNKIKNIGQSLSQLPALSRLNITHNDITLITPEQLPQSLEYIYLRNNPFECNCNLQPLILKLNASDSPETDAHLCLESEFVGNASQTSQCPDQCSCACVTSNPVSFMSVDCSSTNLSVLPQVLKKEDAVISQTVHPSLYLEDRILAINLENNHLASLEGIQLPPNLIQLYLANNELRRLPESVFDRMSNLERMSLSGNPWICDCNALKFKNWLTSNSRIVKDANDIRCSVSDTGDASFNGTLIQTLTDFDICPPLVGLLLQGVWVF